MPLATILPEQAFELNATAYDEKGKVLLQPEGQLVGLIGSPSYYCNIYHPIGKAHNICFLDTDHDGKFDRYFKVSIWMVAFLYPIAPPKETFPLNPVAYHSIAPEALVNPPSLGVEFQHSGISVSDSGGSFSVAVRNEQHNLISYVSRDMLAKEYRIPMIIPIDGGSIEILSWENKRLTVKFVPPPEGRPLIFYHR